MRSVVETEDALLALLWSVPESRVLQQPAPGEWCLRELALHALFTEPLISKLVHYMARGSMSQTALLPDEAEAQRTQEPLALRTAARSLDFAEGEPQWTNSTT